MCVCMCMWCVCLSECVCVCAYKSAEIYLNSSGNPCSLEQFYDMK